MRSNYLRYITVVLLALLVIRTNTVAFAQSPEPTSAASASPDSSANPSPSSNTSPQPTPASSPSAQVTPVASVATSQGGDDPKSKEEVLGETNILGATDSGREMTKWLFAAAVGALVLVGGIKVARSVGRGEE